MPGSNMGYDFPDSINKGPYESGARAGAGYGDGCYGEEVDERSGSFQVPDANNSKRDQNRARFSDDFFQMEQREPNQTMVTQQKRVNSVHGRYLSNYDPEEEGPNVITRQQSEQQMILQSPTNA